jgi:delta(3,5)-delta(2,4)-dienoyl-CoA isomerase
LNLSKILPNEEILIKEGLELAKLIASKSPIAVQGSKVNLVYSRDHSVEEGLKFMVLKIFYMPNLYLLEVSI